MLRRVTLIEDETLAVEASLMRLLKCEQGYVCHRELWGAFSAEKLAQLEDDLLISVTARDPEPCLRLYERLRTHPINPAVLIILPDHPSEELLRLAGDVGDDFLLAPVREGELRCRLTKLLGERGNLEAEVQRKLNRELGLKQLVGESRGFLREIGKIPAIAGSEAPALLLGETGTGKELCAHAIHSLSPRHAGAFVPVDCGTIPEQLLENELFGHARGAFTDAHSDHKGLAALADGGTLFLDEIDSLSLLAQSKLLRFIETGAYRPLGAQRNESANVRLIAATNRDLETHTQSGAFRRDLFFRLNVLPLKLPPLRSRKEDIALLANHFLRSVGASSEKKFTASAMRALENYDWPGNVRELYNVVRRAMTFSGVLPIQPEHLGLASAVEAAPAERAFQDARRQAVASFEKQYVEELLRKHHGNVTRAAIDARKDRRVFGRLIKKYHIDRSEL